MAGDGWLPWISLETIHLGAEAEVISGTWIGRDAVLKRRIPRGYRHPVLERNLSRQRIFAEARILVRLCENGIKSPILFGIDPVEGWIMMSKIGGRSLAQILKEDSDDENENDCVDTYDVDSTPQVNTFKTKKALCV